MTRCVEGGFPVLRHEILFIGLAVRPFWSHSSYTCACAMNCAPMHARKVVAQRQLMPGRAPCRQLSASTLVLALFATVPVGAQTVSQAVGNLFSGARLYVDPASAAKRQADAWRRSRPADAALMDKIAAQPIAQWVGGWNVDIGRDIANAVSRVTGANSLPVFVAYNIPGR